MAEYSKKMAEYICNQLPEDMMREEAPIQKVFQAAVGKRSFQLKSKLLVHTGGFDYK